MGTTSTPFSNVKLLPSEAPVPDLYLSRQLIIDTGYLDPSKVPVGTILAITSSSQIMGLFAGASASNPPTNPTYYKLLSYFAATSKAVFVFNAGTPTTATPATPATLVCGTTGLLATFQALSDANFAITANGTVYNYLNLNFESITALSDIPTVLNAYATTNNIPITASFGTTVEFTTTNTGAAATISILSTGTGTGTDISGATYLNGITGITTNGANAVIDYTNTITTFQTWLSTNLDTINGGNVATYLNLLPNEWYGNAATVSLIETYSELSQLPKFIIEVPTLTPATDSFFTSIKTALNLLKVWNYSIVGTTTTFYSGALALGCINDWFNPSSGTPPQSAKGMPCENAIAMNLTPGASGQVGTALKNGIAYFQTISGTTDVGLFNLMFATNVIFNKIWGADVFKIQAQQAIDNQANVDNVSDDPSTLVAMVDDTLSTYNQQLSNTLTNLINRGIVGAGSVVNSYIPSAQYQAQNPDSEIAPDIWTYSGFSANIAGVPYLVFVEILVQLENMPTA